jgi:streptogramin lyase
MRRTSPIATGTALTTTPAGNGTVPQSTINTIADILASCVNSNGAVTGPTNPTACYTLFNNIMSAGATGPQATDTATAAIYLAQNPYPGSTQMANLFGSPAPASPFTPSLSSQPNDFTVGLIFSGGGIARPLSIAIDGSGNVWTGNYTLGVGPTPGTSSLSELAGGTGTPISGASGYTGGGLNQPNYIAIDTAGNAWVADEAGSSLSRFDGSTGTTITGGGVNNAFSVAIDGSGNVWDDNYGDNSLSKFNSAGTAAASTAYTGGGLN